MKTRSPYSFTNVCPFCIWLILIANVFILPTWCLQIVYNSVLLHVCSAELWTELILYSRLYFRNDFLYIGYSILYFHWKCRLDYVFRPDGIGSLSKRHTCIPRVGVAMRVSRKCDIVNIFCLVSIAHFNCIVKDSLNYDLDRGAMWHSA